MIKLLSSPVFFYPSIGGKNISGSYTLFLTVYSFLSYFLPQPNKIKSTLSFLFLSFSSLPSNFPLTKHSVSQVKMSSYFLWCWGRTDSGWLFLSLFCLLVFLISFGSLIAGIELVVWPTLRDVNDQQYTKSKNNNFDYKRDQMLTLFSISISW